MNDKITISTFQLFEMFPDQESARLYLEARLWPQGVKCPTCKSGERITTRKGGFYRCNACHFDFTVRTGTIFGRSHVPLHKWLYAMYLLVTSRKGVSSLQLSKEIGITQKSAWFVLHRLREACGSDLSKLQGIVEIDETYVGGKESNKHQNQKLHAGRGTVGKVAVLGMRSRAGGIRAKVITGTSMEEIQPEVCAAVAPGATICTDEHAAYNGMDQFIHLSVNHSAKEYVKGEAHTNGIESVWAVFKRGLYGVYHHASKQHLNRYVNEFAFRLDDGNVKRHTMDRLDRLTAGAAGADHLQGIDGMSSGLPALDAITDKVLAYHPPANGGQGMQAFLKIHQQGPDLMADSRAVAKVFGIQHESLRKLIEDHSSQLQQLGHLRFEIGRGVARPQGGGTQEKFAYLNFDQVAFLLTLSRPTEDNKEFRLRLIIAFRDARNRLRPIDRALLSIPDEWKKTFPDDFYTALLRLYGDEFKKSENKPSWVGRWTNRFIYEPLYSGLPTELKQRRKIYCDGNDTAELLKLHTFIEEHAKKNLEKHITKVTALLQAATSKSSFYELFTAVFYGQKQLLLGHSDAPDEFA